jgi:peptide/nickel transport system permease protein
MAVAEPFLLANPQRMVSVKVRARRLLASSRRIDLILASALIFVTLFAIFAPMIDPTNPLAVTGQPFTPPFHAGHLLGTDDVGRDILSRVLAGIRTSWFSALIVIASGVLFGGAIGLCAGACGGVVDTVLMRFTDAILALPGPVVAIAVVASLGPSLDNTIIALMFFWWPFYARIVRGEIRALAARPHLEAARLAGVGPFRRAFRHLLPGAMPAVVITASLDVSNLLITLSALSFLGLGAPQPAPELGAMAAQNIQYLLQNWWLPVMPAVAIFLLALIGNLSGDAVRNLMGRS